jgi:hypothetical protein
MSRLTEIVAYRCNDSGYNDLPESAYNEAILFTSRKVARNFSLLNRHYSFNVKTPNEDDLVNPIELKLHSFGGETMVLVNNVEHKRTDNLRINDTEERLYQLYWGVQNYLFNYTFRTKDDRIDLFYTADITVDDYDDESITPIIPQRYDEEMIKFTILYLCEIAIARFTGAKKEKWITLFQFNKGKTEGTESGEVQTWPTLKVFKII